MQSYSHDSRPQDFFHSNLNLPYIKFKHCLLILTILYMLRSINTPSVYYMNKSKRPNTFHQYQVIQYWFHKAAYKESKAVKMWKKKG